MIKGEYRGASLGWLVAILVAVGVWALIWGPTDDDAPVDDDVPANDDDPTTTKSASPTTEAALPEGNLDGPVLRRSPPFADASLQMAVEGVVLLDGGCLLLASDTGGQYPLVWPAGTAWSDDTSEVVLADDRRVPIGARISGSGGAHEGQTRLRPLDEAAREVVNRCSRVEPVVIIELGNNPRFVETVTAPIDAVAAGRVDGPVVGWPLPYSLEGTDAEVGGVLVLRGDCLQFEYGPDAEAGYLPIVWPSGTAWDPDRLEVVLPAGDRIGIGATVAGGGGYPYADGFGSFDEAARALLQSCADNEWNEVAAFNNRLGAIGVTAEPADDPNVDGLVVRRPFPYLDEGEDAGIQGTLELSDGCLLVAHQEHEEVEVTRFPVVWPAGTAWDATTESVVLATGERIAIGEEVQAAGGYYQPEALQSLGDLSSAAIARLDRCATGESREVVRINNQADAARPAG